MATSLSPALHRAPPNCAANNTPHHHQNPSSNSRPPCSVQAFSSFRNTPSTALRRTSNRLADGSAFMATGTRSSVEGLAGQFGAARASSSSSSSASASTSSSALEAAAAAAEGQKEAAEMVQEFYGAINRREIASIGDLFADDCVYEDLVFPKPFVGRKAILEFFQKFMDSVGSELEFKVDDITTGDPDAAGVTWHLEWKGKPFPFSKGCSFYRCEVLNGKRQFVYGRDAVEPATKPGDLTLVALKGLATLLRRFPSIADKF